MSGRITLVANDGTALPATRPWADADHVVVEGASCSCGALPLKVSGSGIHARTHDTYKAIGHCTSCKSVVGELQVQVSTIFGIEEDERVLRGRYRVY